MRREKLTLTSAAVASVLVLTGPIVFAESGDKLTLSEALEYWKEGWSQLLSSWSFWIVGMFFAVLLLFTKEMRAVITGIKTRIKVRHLIKHVMNMDENALVEYLDFRAGAPSELVKRIDEIWAKQLGRSDSYIYKLYEKDAYKVISLLESIGDNCAKELMINALDCKNAEARLVVAKSLFDRFELKDIRLIRSLVALCGDKSKPWKHSYVTDKAKQDAFDLLSKIVDPRVKDCLAELRAALGKLCLSSLTYAQIRFLTECLTKAIPFSVKYFEANTSECGDQYYSHTVVHVPAKLEFMTGRPEIDQEYEYMNLPFGFQADVPFWDLKVEHILPAGESQVSLDRQIEIALLDRCWIWSSLSSFGRKKSKEKIKEALLITRRLIPELANKGVIAESDSIVSVYLSGSYPWVERPNDIDLVCVVVGEQEYSRASAAKLGIETDVEIYVEMVGLDTLKKAAKGKNVLMSKIVRRKLVSHYGAVRLVGADIFERSKPPLECFRILRGDLIVDAKRAHWPAIRGNRAKIRAKRRWRKREAKALEAWIKAQEKVQNGGNIEN